MSESSPGIPRFQVHEARPGQGRLIATGRELEGRLRPGMRVRVQDGSADFDLTVARIVAYGHELDALDPGLTALVELEGESVALEQGVVLISDSPLSCGNRMAGGKLWGLWGFSGSWLPDSGCRWP